MPDGNPAVTDVVGAILNGTPIDWLAVEARASAAEHPLLDELRLVCAVADLHRHLPLAHEEPPDGPDGESPQYWGRLRLIERIGGGAFGEVYRAWDPRLHREVALKLIMPDASGDRGSAAIIREGRLLARVRHPAVVTIYDTEQIGSRVGLSMEFVEGLTLEQHIRQHGALTPAYGVEIGIQLCDALSAVHEAGVLHRDVKAANVIVRADGRIVLMDLGAGRHLDDDVGPDVTGTPLYLAPEVLRGGDATVRSDIYSLGVLLHYMLTGSYPVEAQSLPELHQAHGRRLEEARGTRRRHSPGIPDSLADILDRAVDPRAERRHESAAALARQLRAWREQKRGARRPVVMAAAALVLLAVSAGLVATAWYAAPKPIRLAVLPFDVRGDQADIDLLREGTARDLIARLQSYDNARVTSIASVMAAGGLNLPLSGVAERLGVACLLTGSITRSGETVEVDARLESTGRKRPACAPWSRAYRRPATEMLDLRRTMALDVATHLRLERKGARQEWPTRSIEAHNLYVRGLTELDKFTPAGSSLALKLFLQAIDIDPEFAEAHAAIARAYLPGYPSIANVSYDERLQRAEAAVARALAIDGSIPEAHVAVALVKSGRADWVGAEDAYRLAIDLGPSSVIAREQYAHWLSLHGRHEEAFVQAREALQLDQLSPRSIMAMASALRFARRYGEANAESEKALAIDPNYRGAYLNLGHGYQGLGELDKAIEAFGMYVRRGGNYGNALAQAGRVDEARALIRQFEEHYAETGIGAGDIAQIYCGLGEIDRAFEWLDRDTTGGGWPTTLKVAAVWDPLRSDERFARLLKKRGLTD